MYFLDPPLIAYKWLLFVAVVIIGYLFVLLLRFFSKLYLEWHSYKQEKIDFTAYQDKRPPVLYLRPFAIDGLKKDTDEYNFSTLKLNFGLGTQKVENYNLNAEYEIAQQVKNIGPLFAIGCNQLNHFEQFGATRFYYSDSEWQKAVINRMKASCMIIMVITGYTGEGVQWELEQIFNQFLGKTIFLIKERRKLENENPLIQEYFKKYNKVIKKFSENTLSDNYVEFNESGICSISGSLARTKLFDTLQKLVAQNRQNKYCYNCGASNDFKNILCCKCRQSLDFNKNGVDRMMELLTELRKQRNEPNK